jgi:hypothetical protein
LCRRGLFPVEGLALYGFEKLLIRSEQLTMEQAIMALNHARKHKPTGDEALAELKWTCRLPYTDQEMQVAADDSEGED